MSVCVCVCIGYGIVIGVIGYRGSSLPGVYQSELRVQGREEADGFKGTFLPSVHSAPCNGALG